MSQQDGIAQESTAAQRQRSKDDENVSEKIFY
jgi:hypothetical protein